MPSLEAGLMRKIIVSLMYHVYMCMGVILTENNRCFISKPAQLRLTLAAERLSTTQFRFEKINSMKQVTYTPVTWRMHDTHTSHDKTQTL